MTGLTPDHVSVIESLQPYNRNAAMRHLREISNREKHRYLVNIDKWTLGQVIMIRAPRQSASGRQLPSGETLEVEAGDAVLIVLPDGHFPVTRMLRQLQSEVTRTVGLFTGELR